MVYTGLVTAVSGEVTAAMAAALPIAGIVIGAMIGYRIFKHFVKG